MKVIEQGALTLVKGIKASGINCGIKSACKDLALIFSEVPATTVGVFTQNCALAAPVMITKENLVDQIAQAIIVNSGIANACTGKKGLEDAREIAFETAAALKIYPHNIVVASTGRIGRYLPLKKIISGIKQAVACLSEEGGDDAAEAILTTDNLSKKIAVQIEYEGSTITIAGMAKGAGMIRPNMATMLAFILTDASIEGGVLQSLLSEAVNKSFNRITIDGDTSTNDMVIVMANGLSDTPPLNKYTSLMEKFKEGLELICHSLASMIVKDGEGATKYICLKVMGARTEAEALKIAYRIAESPLVKTSLYGGSCNWGRIVAAAGSSGVPVNPQNIDISYGHLQAVQDGLGLGEERDKEIGNYLKAREITITVDLKAGNQSAQILTTDLSPEYVRINAEYIT